MRGDDAQFVVLAGGHTIVERGGDPGELAAAATGALAPPFRAEAVRRGEDRWALGLRRIEVVALPDLQGEQLLLTVHGQQRETVIDGAPGSPAAAALAPLLREGDYVVEAVRLEGPLWEVRTALL
jgi:hypothetical protein